jgi:hypothetical protein
MMLIQHDQLLISHDQALRKAMQAPLPGFMLYCGRRLNEVYVGTSWNNLLSAYWKIGLI